MYKINRYLKEINNRAVYLSISFLLTSGLSYFFLNEFYYVLTQLFSYSKLMRNTSIYNSLEEKVEQSDNVVVTHNPRVGEISDIMKSLDAHDGCYASFPGHTIQNNFIFTDITEAFQTSILSIILISFLIHIPFLVYHIWCFIAPSFFQQEKKIFTFFSRFFLFQYFLSNLFIIYLIFPISWEFFSTFEINNNYLNIHSEIRLSSYISFLLKILSLSHFIFQMPFFISILLKFQVLKIIDLKNIFSKRKYIFWCLILICSILTPPDFFIQLTASILLFILFEITFFLTLVFFQYQQS